MMPQHGKKTFAVDPSDPRRHPVLAFAQLTPSEEECRSYANEVVDEVLSKLRRERHLKRLIVAIEGLCLEDHDEPMAESSFSHFMFYKHYIDKSVFFELQFDFLMRCVCAGACLVKDPRAFKQLLADILTTRTEDFRLPPEVTDYDRLKEEDECRRIEAFVLRKDWVSSVP
ncbi:hypothetical protein DIPPA_02001 [Diplonema papillatum]|nr:hypothetical protein DIPPA_02001 [Diplonema papillatum]